MARVVACSRAVVGGWAWTVSPSLPCAPIHRMCSMNSHPSPSHCFLLECTPPFPEWPGFPLTMLSRWTGRAASQQPATIGFKELIWVLEQPMMGSRDGREAGGCMVGGLVEWGGGQGRSFVGPALDASCQGWCTVGPTMSQGPSLQNHSS